ncbi:MAG: hypothetical protein ACLTYN_09085 [Dysosmobacter welbionis]
MKKLVADPSRSGTADGGEVAALRFCSINAWDLKIGFGFCERRSTMRLGRWRPP